MKHIKSALIIIALFAALSADAKQLRKKITTEPTQPSYAKATESIPTLQSQPFIITQPETALTYSEIYNSLLNKTPQSQDIIMLHNIKREVEQQIQQTQGSVGKKTTTKFNKPTVIRIQTENNKLRKYLSEQIDENKLDLISAIQSMNIEMVKGLAGHIALACINELAFKNIKRDDFINIFLDLIINKQMMPTVSQQNKNDIRYSIADAWDNQANWFANRNQK
jgi:hypothetical protein